MIKVTDKARIKNLIDEDPSKLTWIRSSTNPTRKAYQKEKLLFHKATKATNSNKKLIGRIVVWRRDKTMAEMISKKLIDIKIG